MMGSRGRTEEWWASAAVVAGTSVGLILALLGPGIAPPRTTSATPKRLPTSTLPPPSPPRQIAVTHSYCLTQMWTEIGDAGLSGQGSWSQALSAVSGPYSAVLYESGSTFASCFIGPSFGLATVNSLNSFPTGGGGVAPIAASDTIGYASPGGGIDHVVVHTLSLAEGGSYTLVEGSLDPAVSAVSLTQSDGQQVTATTANGWFVAWWPGSEEVTAAQITSDSGMTTVPVLAAP